MVVKSQGAAKHCQALGHVFHILRKHKLRLNLGKCSFEVRAGKFLGFMLIERGIEANPEKCQAVVNMRSPQSVKEVQQFMGKITALSRFISREAETAMPIFGTLKKGGNFVWMPKCEEAFLRLKAMMATPLVLTRPHPSTLLYLYISVSDAVVSFVLIQEKEGEQRPVYFTSKVPKDREGRPGPNGFAYTTSAEKVVLGGKNGSIERPIVRIRHFIRREGHVKAQVLANFIMELTPNGSSATDKGSGVGIILEGSDGVLIEQSLHFNFRASNNQEKYEALLAGMRLARELEAKRLTAKSDSKLVTGQVNNEYQVRDPQLTKYREQAVKLAFIFEKILLVHVPRDQNELADLLAKLASTQRKGQQKSVIHENLEAPTIDKGRYGTLKER
ncbi:Tf2-8, partial [Mucuna pruriens]